MSDPFTERPDLKPDDLTPRGYVRVPGGGLVHMGVLLAGGGLLALLLWRLSK